MSTIKDNQPLCEIIREKPNPCPTVRLYKTLNGKENITDNWLECSRYEYKKEKIKEHENIED